MIVAITGGTGFIGRKLVVRHLVQGHEVRVLSRRKDVEPGAKLCSGDLSNTDALRSFADGADILYHCAGEIRDETRMHAVHLEGTQHLIDAASGRIGRWVQLSSVGAYGRQRGGIVTEQTEPHPTGIYEVTKVLSDELVSAASHGGAFEHMVLRPSNVYGAEMSNQSLFGLISMIRCGRFFFIGAPGASANYIHVDNVVEALMLCGTKPEADGQIYNLSDHRTMEQFVAVIAKSLGRPIPSLRVPEWSIRLLARLLSGIPGFPLTESRIDALTGRAIYSTEKIENELAYRHPVSMEVGLNELVQTWQHKITG
ncbi:aurachin B dehydrogenase [Rhodoferax lithotrophicus]|uniref:Aurachin B dehydrogenase n=1 Tax=Rhodoferax lithotrophicus TaxID=2798804 RepID=A0ABN6DB99_9BURK|nr:NAD-dependent epimerase/dehydratase family protein [Rhodoferax sp. MIZ03]BCO29312.1 aurachin B dehydrogenase [Rhodoferax sp. MIZ03]